VKNTFDTLRDKLLAALYNRNHQEIELLYGELWNKIKKSEIFSEADQKAVSQILAAFQKFKHQILEKCSNDVEKKNRCIRSTLAGVVRKSTKALEYVGYESWVNKIGLSEKAFHILLKTVSSFQLTTGCSNFCRRCNEWALAGPRKHFTFDAVKKLTTGLQENGNRTYSYYSASDPLDWEHGEKNIIDVVSYIMDRGYQTPFGFLTKVPKGTEQIAGQLLKLDTDLAISVTRKNRHRVNAIEKKIDKKLQTQHDDDDLLIPAGLDEDFETIKASITDNYGTEITPEGAFMIIPTFTSALNLTGQCRIPVTVETPFFLKKKVGRDAWTVEYFKPLKVISVDGREFVLDSILDAQVENILQDDGTGDPTPPGMMNLNEYFQTYEGAAVRQRKRLFRTVARDLKKKMLPNGRYREQPDKKRILFKNHLGRYLEFCHPPHVMQYKKNAFSFLLASIACYLKRRPDGRDIVLHLRKTDKKKYAGAYHQFPAAHKTSVEALIDQTDKDTFDLFQKLMFILLKDPGDRGIHRFIQERPVIYDSALDKFVLDPRGQGVAS